MGNAANAKSRNARQKMAAQKAAQRAAERRRAVVRKRLLAGGSVVVVLALVVTLIVVKLTEAPPTAAAGASAATTAQIEQQVTSVPAADFNAVGAGTASGFNTISGASGLTSGGKPELLYVGGEFCPYCAAERWVLAATVSRFGTLTGLHLIHSSPTDTYANTPTLSFVSAHYTSKYLAFDPVEWFGEADDASNPFGHVYLQQPTAQEQSLFSKYADQSIPFVDIGNRYVLPEVQYVPSALAKMSWTQVAAAMRDPSSSVGKDIDGAVNIMTAEVCTLTHGQPGRVCQSAGVQAAAKSTSPS